MRFTPGAPSIAATSEKPARASSVAASVSGSSVRSRHRPVSSSTAATLSICRSAHGGADDAAVGDRAPRRPRRGRASTGTRAAAGTAASTRSLNAGSVPSPPPSTITDGSSALASTASTRPELRRRRVDERGVRRVGDHVLGPLGPGRQRERAAAGDALDRRRAERDRVPARAGIRHAVDDQAHARARADDRRTGTESARRRRRTPPRRAPPPARPTRGRRAAPRSRRPRSRSRQSTVSALAGRPSRSTSSHSPIPTGSAPSPSCAANAGAVREHRRGRPARAASAAGARSLKAARGRRRRDRRRSSSRRRRCRRRASRMPPETCVFHRSIVSYPEAGGGSTIRGGNVKRRLTGLLVIVAVALVAVGVGVSYGGGKATTTLTMWSYDNQDPGSRAGAQAAEQGVRGESSRREDQPGLQGLQQPRGHGASGARVRAAAPT